MEKNTQPARIVAKMMENDLFSQWLGIDVVRVSEGSCELKMRIRKEMMNGFGIAHGGITFAFADSALAFASNSRNKKSLVIDASLSFTAPVKEGDEITAIAREHSFTGKTGVYLIEVTNQEGRQVAIFKGTVYRKPDEWFRDE